MIPFERFAAMEVEARERLGPLRTFRILRVTHYPRSDDVAVDFAAIYGDGTRDFTPPGLLAPSSTQPAALTARCFFRLVQQPSALWPPRHYGLAFGLVHSRFASVIVLCHAISPRIESAAF